MRYFIKKILIFIIIFNIFFYFCSTYADDLEDDNINENVSTLETSSNDITNLNINARSCIVIDRLSKKKLYGKNENNRVKMASTTNIVTT